MSYINEALRKVQKDKDSRYAGYEHIVAAPLEETKPPRKWLPIAGLFAGIMIAVGIIAALYLSKEREIPLQAASLSPASTPVVDRPEPGQSVKVNMALPKAVAPAERKQEIEKPVGTQKDIKKSDSLFVRAVELQRQGKLQKAQALYRKAIKLNPDNVQALNNLGVTYISQGKYKRAIARFNDVLKIRPDYTDAHYNLACVYAKKNNPDRSMLYLKDAIDRNPEVRKWAEADSDLKAVSELPSYKKLMESQ